MVCSICKELGHTAPTCNSELLNIFVNRIKALWLNEREEGVLNDIQIKAWVRGVKIGNPTWRRIFIKLRKIYSDKGWWKSNAEQRNNPAIKFIVGDIGNAQHCKTRILEYERPNEIPAAFAPRRRQRRRVANIDYNVVERPGVLERPVRNDETILDGPLGQAPPEYLNAFLNEIHSMRQLHATQTRQLTRQLRQLYNRVSNAETKLKKSKITVQMDSVDTKYFTDSDCPICLDSMDITKMITFNCKHGFCASCVKLHIKFHDKQTCPACRVPVTEFRVTPALDPTTFNTITNHLNTLDYRL